MVNDDTSDTETWTKAKLDKEYKRLSHTATQVGSYLFVIGGYEGQVFSPEMLLFNLGACIYIVHPRLYPLIPTFS